MHFIMKGIGKTVTYHIVSITDGIYNFDELYKMQLTNFNLTK